MSFEAKMRDLPCNNNRAGIQHDDRSAYRKGYLDTSLAAANIAKDADVELARLNALVGDRALSEYDQLRAYLAGAAPAMLKAFDRVREQGDQQAQVAEPPEEDRRTRYERATA